MEVKNKYHNGKIYSIRSYSTDKFYIGSTIQPLHKRLYHHKKDYVRFSINNKYHYVSSFEIIKLDDCYIELLEEYKCENKNQLNRREGEMIRKYKDMCVNKYIAGRTDKEYSSDNKEKINLNSKVYYETFKDKVNSRNSLYYQRNKEKYQKFRDDNKEKQKLLKQITCVCECKKLIRLYNKPRHEKTIKHLNALKTA